MAPRRGAGRVRVRRSRGGRTPRSGHGGRHGSSPMPSSSPLEEGFWRYDFFLRVRSRNATRVLPSSFSAIVAEPGLDGLLLRLQGSCRSPSYVDLEVDSSHCRSRGVTPSSAAVATKLGLARPSCQPQLSRSSLLGRCCTISRHLPRLSLGPW